MIALKSIAQHTGSDEELLTTYQSTKSQNILAALYLRYTDLVYGVCLKYFKDGETAKDAVMNIYEVLVKKLQTHTIETFKPWLYTVAKNYCLMQLRKIKKTKVVEFHTEFMQSEDFTHLDNMLAKEKILAQLEICVEGLSNDQKESVRMFYVENKCYNEIAAVTGKDWSKVRSLIQNGRRNLKICIEQNG